MTQVGTRQIADTLAATKTGTALVPSGIPGSWVTGVKSDATDLTGSIGFYVGGAGDVHARTVGNPSTTVIFAGLTAGTFIAGTFTRLMAATTATSVLVAYP